jgi:hypothetical protein
MTEFKNLIEEAKQQQKLDEFSDPEGYEDNISDSGQFLIIYLI